MTSQYVQAGDLRMHYHEWGEGSPVILIHGWPESSREWRFVGPALAARGPWRVLAVDTRGYGLTERPDHGYDRESLAGDIVAFMDALEIDRAAVVAHDWGGAIAFKLAIDHPERVSRLAMLEALMTGWPPVVNYYYWFKVPGLAEKFFAEYARPFVQALLGMSPDGPVPEPPEGPFLFKFMQQILPPSQWATEADTAAYADPYATGKAETSCQYYRALKFSRVLRDPDAPNGERYEPVSDEEMGAAWLDGRAGGEHLIFGVEDRFKTYPGPVLVAFSATMARMIGDDVRSLVPMGDRNFPDVRTAKIPGSHFFPEESPEATTEVLAEFLGDGGRKDRGYS